MSDRPTPGVGSDGPDRTRIAVLAGLGLAIVGLMALIGPKVGPIGVGTLLALGVAVVATRSSLRGHRDRRLR